MCTQINNYNPSIEPTNCPPPEQKHPADERVAGLMQQVIDQKQAYVDTAMNNRWTWKEGVQIGGDLFSMGYLAFQGAQIVSPSLAANLGVGIATAVCGVIAGGINIGVAFVCLAEGIQASKNGDKKLALRLYLDFACFLAIGIIMMLASLAARVGALGAISTFFTANPWLLPVLFFIVSVPVIVEIANRIKNIWQKTNLGAQLETDHLDELIQGEDPQNPYHLKPILEMAERGVDEPFVKLALSQKMEQFQADMGVEAALETFRLMKQILKKEDTHEQLEKTKKKLSEWKNAQYVRMGQQILYTAAFGVSMGALTPQLNIPAVNGAQTFATAGANAIPLYMDTFWPFKRNTPIVVPMVE